MDSVNRVRPVFAGWHRCKYVSGCRPFLTSRNCLILVSLITVIYLKSNECTYSIRRNLMQGLDLKYPILTKRAVAGRQSLDNALFTRKILISFFLVSFGLLLFKSYCQVMFT